MLVVEKNAGLTPVLGILKFFFPKKDSTLARNRLLT